MMSQANVRSVDAIRAFKHTLQSHSEDVMLTLTSMEMELRQARNWLERDQYSYWTAQVKRCNERIAEARGDLFRRRLSQSSSGTISDSDQKEAVRVATRKLREAEEMVERIKKWVPILEHAIDEYHSQSQPLSDRLSGSLVGSLALLERMVVSLNEYEAIRAPSAPKLDSLDAGQVSEPIGTPAVGSGEPAVVPTSQGTQDRASEQAHGENPDQPQAERNGLDEESRSNASTASNEA